MILAENIGLDTSTNEDAANLVIEEWGVLL
jgi:hypothetical protein